MNYLPLSSAPTDGTLIRLLVQFEYHATEDTSGPAWTIGACTIDDEVAPIWQFAGWDWSQDRFTEGYGVIIGWLPLSPEQGQHIMPIEDPVTVPRGLLGAACSAIANKYDAPNTLEQLRKYTAGERAEMYGMEPWEQDRSDLIAALLEDAKHHEEIAGDCDCRPEDTVNWQHKLNCERAAAALQSAAQPDHPERT